MGNWKKSIHFLVIAVLGGLFGSLWLATSAQAQTGRIDDFTFFIPFYSENLLAQFKAGNNPVNQATEVNLQTTISIPVNRSGTTIYYDHWEDGYEADLTLPTQSSTQIWGDGETANGVAPTVRDQGGGDFLMNDDVILLDNLVLLPGGIRDPAIIYFDGGDALTALGGSIAVTEVVWPVIGDTNVPGSLYTDSWELYPTGLWGKAYIIPVGQDLASLRPGFTVVGVNVQAAQDETSVTVTDKNGNVKSTATLNYGQELNLTTGILSGDRITASGPVQVQLFTADPTQNYEQRGYTMLPFGEWEADYVAPRSSNGDFWLYNPQTTPLTVTVTMTATTDTVIIPPEQTVRYSNTGAGLSTATGARFTAGALFYGLVALDPGELRDWGYSLQPARRLTSQTLIGWAPGNNRMPPTDQGNYSPVYVTAVTPTTVTVNYADDTPDVDIFVPALAQVPITSPNENMTGALLSTKDGTPFLAVWGESETAPVGQPAIDAGSNIVPIFSLALQKSFRLRDSFDCSGTIGNGDRLRFSLRYFNNAAYGGSTTVTLLDDLPSELEYVPQSSRLNGVSIPDGPGGLPPLSTAAGGVTTAVDQGGSGLLTFDTVISGATTLVTNRAVATSPLLGQAEANVSVPFNLVVKPILKIDKRLVNPTVEPVTWGEVITFGLTITNTSNQINISQLSLEDTFSETDITFLNANLMPDLTAAGILTWTNLVTDVLSPGEVIELTTVFQVNPVPSTVTQIINQAAFSNVESGDGEAQILCSDETIVNIVAPTATPTVTATPLPTPTPTPTATRPSTATPDRTPPPTATPDNTPSPTAVTPTPGASVTGTPFGTTTPSASLTPSPSGTVTGTVLPVELLPETGRFGPDREMGLILVILGLIGTSLFYFFYSLTDIDQI